MNEFFFQTRRIRHVSDLLWGDQGQVFIERAFRNRPSGRRRMLRRVSDSRQGNESKVNNFLCYQVNCNGFMHSG